MPTSTYFAAPLILLCGFGALADAQTSKSFVGSWALESYERRGPSGEVTYPYGRKPVGLLTYDAQGHMSVQIMNPDRNPFAADRMGAGSPAEKLAAFDTYIAYSGTYTVEEAKQVVHHHVEISLFPNWVGSDQRRQYEFASEQLILRAINGSGNGSGPSGTVSRLVWVRAAPSK